MALGAYIANSWWGFPLGDDGRGYVAPGKTVILDATQAAAATAAGTISGSASLSGPQTSALATANANSAGSWLPGTRAVVVLALGLT